jgi:hypothetical protein
MSELFAAQFSNKSTCLRPVFFNYDNEIISYGSLINVFPLLSFLLHIAVALDRDRFILYMVTRLPSNETGILCSSACHPCQKMKNAEGRTNGI